MFGQESYISRRNTVKFIFNLVKMVKIKKSIFLLPVRC